MNQIANTKKYLMYISYIGSDFWGSQIQLLKGPNGFLETVQNVIETGLKYVYNLEGERPIRIMLASRTDTGVHALRAAISVDLPLVNYYFMNPQNLVKELNKYLSKSKQVRVLEAHIVPDSFKFSKVKKEKTYLFRLGLLKSEFCDRRRKNIIPITENKRTFIYHSPKTFDLKRAQEACHLFVGVKDFGAIEGSPSKSNKSTICNITSFNVEESQPLFPLEALSHTYNFYHFICKGDRFLTHMVRRMVSLSIAVGFGNINLGDIQKLFDEPVPSSWPKKGNFVVNGCGLYLVDTKIDLEDFIQKEELNEKKNDELLLENSNEKII